MRTGWAAIWWKSPSTACPWRTFVRSPACSTPSATSSASATINIQDSARELQEKELRFSPTAEKELQVLGTALEDILFQAVSSFNQDDPAAAKAVEPLEETIDQLTEEIRMRHIQRLQTGECTIQLGFVLNDLLTNLERVSDHCSNIAVCVIEERDSSVDHHAYLHRLKVDDNFAEELREDLSKYRLPNA